jgi:hypothetical protein
VRLASHRPGRRAPWGTFLLCLLVAFPSAAEDPATARILDPEVLALCKSSDPAARRYCLKTVGARGDPAGEAKQIIAEMAARDPVLAAEAAQTYARLYGAPPAAIAPAAPSRPPEVAKAEGDPMRVILAPTAFTRPEGTTSFNAFELGTLTFDHGVTRNLAIGLQSALPIGAFVIGPTLRAGIPFEWGAIGVHMNAAVFAPFVGSTSTYVIAGGGPILTLGNYDRYFNLGLLAYAVTSNGDALIIPHAGFSLRVSPGVRLGAEAFVPGAYGKDLQNDGIGKIGIVLWGLRLFGDKFWGDIAVADPICAGCGDLYKVLPLGIPFLNFGLAW